jgi:hypothetical protein
VLSVYGKSQAEVETIGGHWKNWLTELLGVEALEKLSK